MNSKEPLILIEFSLARSYIPILKSYFGDPVILVCLLHPPSAFVDPGERVKVIDWTGNVPGYEWTDPRPLILEEIAKVPRLTLIIDSAHTLYEDLGSFSSTYKFLKTLSSQIKSRPDSRLILPLPSTSPLLPPLLSTSFSTSLTHLTIHPPILLTHLASTYLTLPPQSNASPKFWQLFIPIASRGEGEKLVLATKGDDNNDHESVVEITSRGGGKNRKGGIERSLKGWDNGLCALEDLISLRGIWSKNPSANIQEIPDPTLHLPFNLSLTPSQQSAKTQVTLPYAHQGGEIFYDPDSGDDLDDEDPDEDLDL